jgi:hypothetical protein
VKIPTKKIALAAAMTGMTSISLGAAIEYRDALEVAVTPPDQAADAERTDRLVLYVGNNLAYDNNLYRLPPNVTDLSVLPGIGPSPSREDYIDSITGGADAEWLTGARQSVDVNLSASYNHYFRNENLNNVSSSDRVAWNWGLGDALSGIVGVDYLRLPGGFTNTAVYSLAIVNRSDYFASLRYQVGPRWGLFGGLLGTDYSVSSAQQTFNDSKSKSVAVGVDYTAETNRIGFEYRYNDSRSPNSTFLNGVFFDPDYREDRARVLLRYALSEKTVLDASAGYLKREYPSTAIGNFSGDVWRVALQWQPTPKTQILFGIWQQLGADLTAQTDYYVDKGASITPEWIASEKLTFSASISRDNQDYVGSRPIGTIITTPVTQARRDTLTGATASMIYTPIRALTLTLSAAHLTRDSNIPQFHFNDMQGNLSIVYKFFRYGNAP